MVARENLDSQVKDLVNKVMIPSTFNGEVIRKNKALSMGRTLMKQFWSPWALKLVLVVIITIVAFTWPVPRMKMDLMLPLRLKERANAKQDVDRKEGKEIRKRNK